MDVKLLAALLSIRDREPGAVIALPAPSAALGKKGSDMMPVADPVSDNVILEEAGEDPDQWPEFRGTRRHGKQKEVEWGSGVRSEEEDYLAKLGKSFSVDRGTIAEIIVNLQRADWLV